MRKLPIIALLLLIWGSSQLSAAELTVDEAPAPDVPGIVTVQSSYSVEKTTSRLLKGLEAQDFSVKTVLNHQEISGAIGSIRPTMDILFGKPVYEHALLKETQLAALFVPLNLAIWQAEDEKVYVSYWDPKTDIGKAISFKSAEAIDAITKMSREVHRVVNKAVKGKAGKR